MVGKIILKGLKVHPLSLFESIEQAFEQNGTSYVDLNGVEKYVSQTGYRFDDVSNLIYRNGKPIFKGDPLDATSFLQDMEDYLFDSFKDVAEEKGGKVMLPSKGEVTTYLSINRHISAEKVLQPIWETKLRPKLCKRIMDYRLGAAAPAHRLAKVRTVLSHRLQAHCFFCFADTLRRFSLTCSPTVSVSEQRRQDAAHQ